MCRIPALIVLSFFLFSCAHHPRLDPVIKIPDFYEFKTKKNSLDIIVDPYDRPYKINYLFNTDITKKGILALHLIIWNNGDSSYDMSQAKISVRSLEGKEYVPLSPDQVSKRVLTNTVARMVGFGALGTAFIFFTVPFAVGAGVDSVIANKNIRKDYAEKELKREVIASKALFHGFLFFDLGENSRAFEQPYYFYITGLKEELSSESLNMQIRFELDHDGW